MAHRALLYRIQVHARRDPTDTRELGNFNKSGGWIGEILKRALKSIDTSTVDAGKRTVVRSEHQVDWDTERFAQTFVSGRNGVRSMLSDPEQGDFERRLATREHMRSAVGLWLPRNRRHGVLAVHVPHGHGVKSTVAEAMARAVAQAEVTLKLNPIVPSSVVREGIAKRLSKVTLVKIMRTAGDMFDEAAEYGGFQEIDEARLALVGRRNRSLNTAKILRFLDDPTPENRRSIIEFRGLTFDDAEITVDLPTGSTRTFSLGDIDADEKTGFPLGLVLSGIDESEDRYGASVESVVRALFEQAIPTVAPHL